MYERRGLFPEFETDADHALGAAMARDFTKRIGLTANLISEIDPNCCPLERLRSLRGWMSALADEVDGLIEHGKPVTRTTCNLVLRRPGGR
jgi:hypothetical protein